MTKSRRRLWLLLGLLLVAVAAVPATRWRARVVGLKLSGALDAVTWGEMARMMAPNARYGLEDVVREGNVFTAIRNPFEPADVLQAGEQIYGSRCAICHGGKGVGDTAPPLATGALRHGATDWALYRTIQQGVPATAMPPHDLAERELWGLVAYVRSLASAVPAEGAAPSAPAPEVTHERIQNSLQAGEWLTYSGSFDGRRHSPLTQVNRTNVGSLKLAWTYQMTMPNPAVETVPIVAGTTMYVTEPGGGVLALDARTGQVLWTFRRPLPSRLRMCCGVVNRGVAIQGNLLFVGTIDAHLLALDARTGRVVWDVVVEDYTAGYSITPAPLVVGDKVITGVAGGEFGIRGFLSAYDAQTGRKVWQFYTVPGPGEPGNETWPGDTWKTGGAPTWLTGTYDPELDLLYWGIGHPGPNYRSDLRKGDNLYSNSVVALDPSTGKLRWYFQFTPNENRDWDATQVPVLFDVEEQGAVRRLMGFANRNGFYYLLNRETGQFLAAQAFARQNWAKGIDKAGRPILDVGSEVSEKGVLTYPARPGATNWWSPAYSPIARLFYVPTIEAGAIFSATPVNYRRGEAFLGGLVEFTTERTFSIRALDALTGARRWTYQRLPQTSQESRRAGILSTAGRVILTADETFFVALDDETGKELWSTNLGGPVVAAPITYRIGERQYVTVAAGRAIFTFALPDSHD